MGEKNRYGDLTESERNVLKGVTEQTPKGVSDQATYQRIYQLRRSSLGAGFGLGLIATSIFWLVVVYSSPDLFAY